MTDRERCDYFLSRHRLLAQQYNVQEILAAFMDEMEKGLAGQKSSLAMIPSYVPVPAVAPRDEKIIVLDAGGTNFRTALIMFDRNSVPQIESLTHHSMPGIERELSKEEFFNQIADLLQPVLKESNRLGFCFSYPALIDRHRDGTLLYWTKEVKAPGVVGEKILANLSETIRKRGLPCPAHMIILNDTVASLLAGVTATRFSTDHNYMGFILGTGTNTAYVEHCIRIGKLQEPETGGSMAINCEMANFNKLTRGDIDLAFDSATANPGQYVFEKMISGAYLGVLCHKILQVAADEGIVSAIAAGKLRVMETLSMPFLSTILSGSAGNKTEFAGCPDTDLSSIKSIISEVVERAAVLTAINMSAPIIRLARGGNTKNKYCISADGSVYYKLHSFRERAEKHLNEVLKPYEVEYKIVHIDDAPIIGAAVAGLST